MPNDKELSAKFIQDILENENINSVTLAKELDCSKTFISNVKNGRSSLSKKMYNKIIDLHPSFAKYGQVAYSKLFEESKIPNVLKVYRKENPYLTKDYVNRSYVNSDILQIDKRIIASNYSCDFTEAKFEAVTIANDALLPTYRAFDNIIIDVNVKTFINGFIFAFIHNSNLYVNEITVIDSNKYKSTDINDKCFSFVLEPDTSTEIIGLVVPKIRF